VNPVYDWPGGHFEDLMKQVGLSVGHGLYRDETLSVCEIALPSSHNLESWNDAMAHAGVESLCQPVIRPLYESRQEAESLLKWTQALVPEDDPLHGLEDGTTLSAPNGASVTIRGPTRSPEARYAGDCRIDNNRVPL
jgi:anaerobic selenocysteine-containing dehydrogenase